MNSFSRRRKTKEVLLFFSMYSTIFQTMLPQTLILKGVKWCMYKIVLWYIWPQSIFQSHNDKGSIKVAQNKKYEPQRHHKRPWNQATRLWMSNYHKNIKNTLEKEQPLPEWCQQNWNFTFRIIELDLCLLLFIAVI